MTHYFEASSLPALYFGEPPEISFHDLMILYEANLSPEELNSVKVVRHLVDLYNLSAYWRQKPLDPRGNLSAVEMEEALLGGNGLPENAHSFIETPGALIVQFFHREIPIATGFLRHWLEFERKLRFVMIGFRSKRLGRDPVFELQHEDPQDEIVAHIIAQRDSPTYEPPEEFAKLKEIFAQYGSEPEELHREVSRFRFLQIEEWLEDETFSLGFLLGYMIQLMILEDLK
ncbi:MAG: DUF2764 family protein [Verrucomicrobia bacterium]|nr:DUF2764 family protein [Verrucomicrobiota bacterium]